MIAQTILKSHVKDSSVSTVTRALSNTSADSASERLLVALIESDAAYDLKSLHLLAPEENGMTLKVMLKLPGEFRWRWIGVSELSAEKAVFYAKSVLLHHQHSHPGRKTIIERWLQRLEGSEVPYTGISLMMGMD